MGRFSKVDTALLRVFFAPIIVVQVVRARYYQWRVTREVGRNATEYARGYASAPYMVRQVGAECVARYLAEAVQRRQATLFHAGVADWLVDNKDHR